VRDAAPVTGEPPAYPSPARAWWAVCVFLVLYVLSFVDRQVLNLMIDPIRDDLGIGDFEASLLSGFAFAVFYTFFGIPIARLADSRSRRAIVAAGLAIWSAATATCGLVRTYAGFFLARTGVGVGEAALSPAAYSSIADAFPPGKRGRAMGIYSVGSYLGSGLAFLLGGYVFAFVGERGTRELPLLGEMAPWKVVFLVLGIPGLLLVPLLATVPEPLRRASGAGGRAASLSAVARHMREHWGAYLGHNLGFALLAFSGYGSSVWTPAFLQRSHGMSVADSGIALGWIMAVAGTLGIVFGGWLSDRMLARGRRDATMRVGLIAAVVWIPAGLLYPLVEGKSVALALMVPALFTSGMPWGAAAAAVQEITPGPMRAQATAVYLFVINLIGLGIGPSAVAYLTQYVYRDDAAVRYSLAWVTLAAHVAAALFLWAGLRPFVRARDRLAAETGIE
jgi:MFS family permease